MTLFAAADKAAIVSDIQSDRLISVAANYFPGVELRTDYIYSKLLAAEANAEHRLRVFVEPVVILSEGATQADQDALDAAGTRYTDEPAYDMEPSFFRGDSWGFMVLRHHPVQSIESVKFVYPSPFNGVFEVPLEWVRIDKKYGHMRLVPTSASFAAPLSMFIMQAMAGGRVFPHFIQVRYTAGLTTTDYPDLVDLIKKMAVKRIIDDLYLPQSASDSIDGMSQNFSFDSSKYSESIDKQLESLRQEIHGVRMMVM